MTLEDLFQAAVVELDDNEVEEDDDPTRVIPADELEVLKQVTAIPIVARCSCGISYDKEAWEALPYIGPQDGGELGTFELRNCACLSTIAIKLFGPISDWKKLPKTIPVMPAVRTKVG